MPLPDVVLFTRFVTAATPSVIAGGVVLIGARLLRRRGPRRDRSMWLADLLLAVAVAAAVGVAMWLRTTAAMADVTLPVGMRSYQATARDGHWWFLHPGAEVHSVDEFWVEVGVGVSVTLLSDNVSERPSCFQLPGMGIHRDVPHDRYQYVWFQPTRIGDYPVGVAADCATMAEPLRATLHVVDAATWAHAAWRR